MCLIIKCGCHIEIAKKDIVTFKTVKEHNHCWEPICIKSGFYEFNKVLTAKRYPYAPENTIEHLQVERGNTIYEGFHSDIQKISDYDNICIIPKGSEICYGQDNDIVSLYIIVFKNRLSYLKYRLAKLFKSPSLQIFIEQLVLKETVC